MRLHKGSPGPFQAGKIYRISVGRGAKIISLPEAPTCLGTALPMIRPKDKNISLLLPSGNSTAP